MDDQDVRLLDAGGVVRWDDEGKVHDILDFPAFASQKGGCGKPPFFGVNERFMYITRVSARGYSDAQIFRLSQSLDLPFEYHVKRKIVADGGEGGGVC